MTATSNDTPKPAFIVRPDDNRQPFRIKNLPAFYTPHMKSLPLSYVVVGRFPAPGLKGQDIATLLTISTWYTASGHTARAVARFPHTLRSGVGSASGAGYDKRGAAVSAALESAGVQVSLEAEADITSYLCAIARAVYPDATDLKLLEVC
jgi:hypothetical protein